MIRTRFHLPAFLSILILLRCAPAFAADEPVKVWEDDLVIPTYLIGPPDPNPQFYSGGQSQGAEHRIYPYPLYDNLTTEKADKKYKIVYLENEYLRIGILPESGGKIFEAIDKTNGYNFFYRQHVIKPALISLLGAWISGGVEWDIPHHHRATSFLPVQYRIDKNADGSKTVWVGELELRDRMRWAVGVTLHPGKSYIEASFRMVNRTPVPASMLCFSNVAVSVNDTYQVIFPPRTQHVTYHAKVDFTTWPIATTRFNNTDFSSGVDVSWYKNHQNAMSMFAWNYQDDFFAGYDHGKHAGTMSIADHNVVPGKKFWTWGNGPRGRAQDTLLTDSDGPYIELMVGAYSDNQPDYTWLEPYEARTWTQFWYPFRDIDGVKNANTEAAVNLDVKDGHATLGFCTTSAYPSATVTVKLKDQVLVQEKIEISPAKSYVKEFALPAGADEHDLTASLASDGRELISYSPIKLEPEAMPRGVTPPAAPEQIKTNEELYLTGLRIEQFHNSQLKAQPYWEEALKRDPADICVNTALAVDYIKWARYEDAEKLLRTALGRATDRYTSPKDGEPFYYLGLALRGQGKIDEAYSRFYKSTWSAAWRSPGYFEAAQIATLKGDWETAMSLVERSIHADDQNIRARLLKSALLRRAGHNDQAIASVDALADIDPLDVHAMAERWLADRDPASAPVLFATFGQHPATALETATEYMNAGLWQDGLTLLEETASRAGEGKVSPLIYYDLAYFARRLNDPKKAVKSYAMAADGAPDVLFPFQRETVEVLTEAMKANPSDALAPYYLGTLLFDWQPERAMALWEQSAALGATFPVVYHNLATAYLRRGNERDKALAMLEKAAQLGGNAMVFYDLDKLHEEDGIAPDKRLALMEQHQDVINRDDVITREINLKIFAGKYDDAIRLIESRFFRAWEGGGRFSLGDSWINAHLLRGRQHLAAKDYSLALADFTTAMQFPANLQEAAGSESATRRSEVAYWIGMAHEGMGDTATARTSWHEAAETNSPEASPSPTTLPASRRGRPGVGGSGPGVHVAQATAYFQAMALQKLGENDRANALFQHLADSAGSKGDGKPAPELIAKGVAPADRARLADRYYLAGLGELGLGKIDRSREDFSAALAASPDHLAAQVALAALLK